LVFNKVSELRKSFVRVSLLNKSLIVALSQSENLEIDCSQEDKTDDIEFEIYFLPPSLILSGNNKYKCALAIYYYLVFAYQGYF
jgi:hypothetical protein